MKNKKQEFDLSSMPKGIYVVSYFRLKACNKKTHHSLIPNDGTQTIPNLPPESNKKWDWRLSEEPPIRTITQSFRRDDHQKLPILTHCLIHISWSLRN